MEVIELVASLCDSTLAAAESCYINGSNPLTLSRKDAETMAQLAERSTSKASIRLQLHGLVTGEQRIVPPASVPNGSYLSSYLSQVRGSIREVASSSLFFCFFSKLFLFGGPSGRRFRSGIDSSTSWTDSGAFGTGFLQHRLT